MRSTEIVLAFWDEVWNAHDPDAVDRFVVDDVVVVSGGQEISGKENFKNWIREFLGTTSTTCTSTPSRHFRTRTAPASRPDGC